MEALTQGQCLRERFQHSNCFNCRCRFSGEHDHALIGMWKRLFFVSSNWWRHLTIQQTKWQEFLWADWAEDGQVWLEASKASHLGNGRGQARQLNSFSIDLFVCLLLLLCQPLGAGYIRTIWHNDSHSLGGTGDRASQLIRSIKACMTCPVACVFSVHSARMPSNLW